ncbi:MAG: RtcB family protein [Candidatus Omnitrophica bacterium]|nr:RtcB family protein [Candidatus Omnitrophota bacterium]
MTSKLQRLDEFRVQVPRNYKPGMLTHGIIYANQQIFNNLFKDKAIEQVANTAFLPGIIGPALAMPDIHWGYGFPIGGVVATDIDKSGVISPGGVGFDINCGVRLLKTQLHFEEIQQKIPELIKNLYHTVPAGVGSTSKFKLKLKDAQQVFLNGAAWAVDQGYGTLADLENTEENGWMKNAQPENISEHAVKRGQQQLGTLGSGNHFIEIQSIEKIYDQQIAANFGLKLKQIVVMIHTGSRGLGHQICTDQIKLILGCLKKYNIQVPDRQLACAPVNSPEGQAYLGAMRCAANYAWANRQIIMYQVIQTFKQTLKLTDNQLKAELVYDVAHNIAKIEQHIINNKKLNVCVHRKGATRAFGPGQSELNALHKQTGQPVIIPGDMGTCSYLLVGTDSAMRETFGSTCHGAGRIMSRSQAIRTLNSKQILRELNNKGITVIAADKQIICEEAPQAYKDVKQVIDIVAAAGISKKVCRMKPLGVIKG